MSSIDPQTSNEPFRGTTDDTRTVRRIVSSVGISAVGTWSYNVGIAVYAYHQTGSTAWVAVATVGRYVPALLITWVGSRWADRYPRRTVAVVSDVFCALMMLALTGVALLQGPILLAIAIAALSSGVARIQSAAALSAAADLVTESRLASTAALISTTDAVATAIGPALAALILAVAQPPVLFALNGITFAASAILIAGVPLVAARRVPSTSTSTSTSAAQPAGTQDDAAYQISRRVVWPLIATRAISAVVYGIDIVLLAVLATEQLKQGTAGYGWLLAAAGLGGLLAATWLRSRDGVGAITPRVTLGMAAYTLPLMAFLASPLLPGGMIVEVARGIGSVLVTATVISGLQRMVPSRVSGRIFGLSNIVVMLGTSIGALLAPLLLGALGLNGTLVVVAIVPFVLQLALLPALIKFDREGHAALVELDPKVNVLRKLALFHDANRSTLYDVADNTTDVSVAANTPVVSQGQPSDSLYVLLTGSVDVFIDGTEGKKKVRHMEAPTYFGEIGLLHGVPRTATVITTQDSTLWSVPGEVFLWAASQAGLSGALTENVTHRFGAFDGRAVTLPPTSL